MPCPRPTRAFVALVVAMAGCGEASPPPLPAPTSAQPSAATERAEKAAIRAERKAARLQREKAKLEATRPSTQPAPALPAGSAEIDGAGGASAGGELFSAADERSFRKLAARLSGEEGVAVAPIGADTGVSTLGTVDGGVAWSTSKVPIAMAAIKAGTANANDLRQAITASDNAAAERLWSGLGSPATAARLADAQLRAAGDSSTRMEAKKLRSEFTAFGQTAWGVADQARFVAGMACTKTGPQVLSLMGQVIPGQRWGLGRTGATAQMKGGWGPGISPGTGDGWLDRQMGVIEVGGRKLAVALASTAPDHGTGTANLSELAVWVAAHVQASTVPGSGC